jgi:hypothetical protein
VNRLEVLVSMLDYSLNTKTKRHITGGILMSLSLFFGGLAATVITLKTERNEDEQYLE